MNKKIILIAVIVVLGVAFFWSLPKTFTGSNAPADNGSATSINVNEGTIVVGEAKRINGIQLTLNKIVNDSRCPIGVQCIQAGWVTANVTLKNGSVQETVDVRSGAAPKIFNSFSVSLLKVAPEKSSTQEIKLSEYRLTFRADATQ